MYRFEKNDLQGLKSHGFRHSVKVRFQDVDAAGLVFFARVLEYLHDCYVSFLAHSGSELSEVLREKRWAAPLRHAEADYFHPIRFGEELAVVLAAAHLEETEITLGYQVIGAADQRVRAVGQTVHTFVDPKTFERMPVPRELCEALRDVSNVSSETTSG